MKAKYVPRPPKRGPTGAKKSLPQEGARNSTQDGGQKGQRHPPRACDFGRQFATGGRNRCCAASVLTPGSKFPFKFPLVLAAEEPIWAAPL